MDEADIAGERIDKYEADAISHYGKLAKCRELMPVYKCHYCGDDLSGASQLFCDNLCAADWQAEQDAKKRRNGRY